MIRNKERAFPSPLLERILVPLDGSELAEAMLPKIKGLLRRADSDVILMQAKGSSPDDPDPAEYLRTVAGALESQGVRVRTLTRTGPAAEAILAAAFDEQVTLIAMSTHGRSGIARWALGSVAEKVIRAATVPVLLIRAFAKGARAGELDLKRILVPLDGSEPSARVIKPANELARLYQAQALLLYVEPILMAFPVGVMITDGPPPVVPIRFEAPSMDAFRTQMSTGGVETTTTASKGDAALTILEEAERQDADLIAMTTQGLSGATRWMLGSITEKVLRHSNRPMLIVRSTH